MRAVRLAEPLRLDGNLDEDLYRTVNPISDFIQVEPRAGEPGTERTEVWLSFDCLPANQQLRHGSDRS